MAKRYSLAAALPSKCRFSVYFPLNHFLVSERVLQMKRSSVGIWAAASMMFLAWAIPPQQWWCRWQGRRRTARSRHAEDDVGVGEDGQEGERVVEVGGDHFDALGCEGFGARFGGVAVEAADSPAGLFGEGASYAAAVG